MVHRLGRVRRDDFGRGLPQASCPVEHLVCSEAAARGASDVADLTVDLPAAAPSGSSPVLAHLSNLLQAPLGRPLPGVAPLVQWAARSSDGMESPLAQRAAPTSQLVPKLPGGQVLAPVVSERQLDPPRPASPPPVASRRELPEP